MIVVSFSGSVRAVSDREYDDLLRRNKKVRMIGVIEGDYPSLKRLREGDVKDFEEYLQRRIREDEDHLAFLRQQQNDFYNELKRMGLSE